MIWHPVTSSNIAQIGHDAASKTLGVRFKNGGEHHYADVGADKFAALRKAESVGKFYHAQVRQAVNSRGEPLHQHTKVEAK